MERNGVGWVAFKAYSEKSNQHEILRVCSEMQSGQSRPDGKSGSLEVQIEKKIPTT